MKTKNIFTIAAIIIVALFVIITIYVKQTGILGSNETLKNLSSQKIGERVITLVNNDLAGAAVASLVEVTEEKGLYKVTFAINEREIETYTTLDGELLFTGVINLNEELTKINGQENQQVQGPGSCEEVVKKASPELEAFVVSECPFGLQMQRALSEAVKNIPSLVNNIKVKYIGSIVNGKIIAMHGDQEAQENLRQICIREEQKDKYWNYIDCHIKAGDVNGCLAIAGIGLSSLDSCMADSSRGLTYAQLDFDAEDNYNVTDSPTLILNGQKVSEFTFGGRTADALKDLTCCGFENQPGACSQELNNISAASGFSENYISDGSDGGSCN